MKASDILLPGNSTNRSAGSTGGGSWAFSRSSGAGVSGGVVRHDGEALLRLLWSCTDVDQSFLPQRQRRNTLLSLPHHSHYRFTFDAPHHNVYQSRAGGLAEKHPPHSDLPSRLAKGVFGCHTY